VANSSAISIFWNPPPFLDQNGIIIGYQLMITNQNRTNSSAIVFTNITSYTANMLEEFEVYNIEIAAQTSIGFGPFSDPISNQTFEDGQCVLYLCVHMLGNLGNLLVVISLQRVSMIFAIIIYHE